MYYRGESKDFKETKCLPSIFRINGYSIFFEQELYKNLQKDFKSIAVFEKVVNDAEKYEYYFLKVIGVLQHYGCPTRLLDITRDEDIACYFASCNNFDESGFIYEFDEDKIKEIKTPDAKSIHRKVQCIYNADQWREIDVWKELELSNKNYYTLFNNHIVDYKTVLKDVIGTCDENIRLNNQQGAFIIFGVKTTQDETHKLLDGSPSDIEPSQIKKIEPKDKFSNLLRLATRTKSPVYSVSVFPDAEESTKIVEKYNEIHILFHNNQAGYNTAIRTFRDLFGDKLLKTDILEMINNDLEIWANNQTAFCFLCKEFIDYIKTIEDKDILNIYKTMRESFEKANVD